MVLKATVDSRIYFDTSTTALAIFPGGGKKEASDTRFTEVDWRKFSKKVWVAGTRGDPFYDEEEIRLLLARQQRVPPSLTLQIYAEHSLNQMRWVSNMLCADKTVSTLILSTAEYHLPRCILTFVKTWQREGDARKIRLAAIATSNPRLLNRPNEDETSQTREQEVKRIEVYQIKGDVATANEFMHFIHHKD